MIIKLHQEWSGDREYDFGFGPKSGYLLYKKPGKKGRRSVFTTRKFGSWSKVLQYLSQNKKRDVYILDGEYSES